MLLNLNIERDYAGTLIVYEGIDGSGKSTIASKITQELKNNGINSRYLYEPTNGKYGRKIRQASLKGDRFSIEEELELFIKDRQENKDYALFSSLKDGFIVNLDRYFYSNIAYQGTSGVDPEVIFTKNIPYLLNPDLVLIFDLPVDIALARININREKKTTFEKKDYLEKVSQIYRSFKACNIFQIKADRKEQEVFEEVYSLIKRFLKRRKSD